MTYMSSAVKDDLDAVFDFREAAACFLFSANLESKLVLTVLAFEEN